MFKDSTALNLDGELLKQKETESQQENTAVETQNTILPFSLEPQKVSEEEATKADDGNDIEHLNMDTGEERFISYSPEYASFWQLEERLVPSIFADISKNFLTYFLGIVLCALSLYKVYQVQETRDLTARYNEVMMNNENLHKEWLSLIAQRQTLSEQGTIRAAATQKLDMVAPKTDLEQVIKIN